MNIFLAERLSLVFRWLTPIIEFPWFIMILFIKIIGVLEFHSRQAHQDSCLFRFILYTFQIFVITRLSPPWELTNFSVQLANQKFGKESIVLNPLGLVRHAKVFRSLDAEALELSVHKSRINSQRPTLQLHSLNRKSWKITLNDIFVYS